MERRPRGTHIDERLDEALAESFPASDPPAAHFIDEPPRRASRPRPAKPSKARPLKASGRRKRAAQKARKKTPRRDRKRR